MKQIEGAKSKDLFVRDEDEQVLHGFTSADLQPYLAGASEVRLYDVA